MVNLKGLVGIDEKIADVESWIRKEPKSTRLIGFWGMAGIGKTTLAQQIFNKLRSEYEGSYFLLNEREELRRVGIIYLKKEIFSELLGNVVKINTPNSLPDDRICGMKVLIVLDDVNDSDHIEKLLGPLDNFGLGSRIIITTRDEHVLNANKIDEIYRLRELCYDKALELFNLNAFNQSDHQREYHELSKRMVNYAKGIPLVLKVLANHLRGKNKEVWGSWLDKLKIMPLKEVFDVLKLSYDDLDHKEQQIFLDLACFFLRLQIKINMGNLKSLLKDGESDNSVVAGLERLKDKALITISEDNFVSMHDSLQEMAWEIVYQESKEPGSRSHLWHPDYIYEALKNNKGTEVIRSIQIILSTLKKQKLSPQIFAEMSRLQFLEVVGTFNDDLFDQHCILAKGLRFLVTELKFLYWDYYPLKSLPENFSAKRLVILSLKHGSMKKLWDGVKNLVNLKEVDLSFCKILKELPDLSKATNLEVLILQGCSMVKALPSSFGHQSKLKFLDVGYCSKLQTISKLPQFLKTLVANGCKSHQTLPELPQFLKILGVSDCKSLQTLPKLPLSLENLDITSCTSLQTLPKLPPFLKTLEARFCKSIQTLPEPPPSLETLNAYCCSSLLTLPKLPPSLKALNVQNCKSLLTLPELPPSVENLDVNCRISFQTLPQLPLSLEALDSTGCKSLKTILFPSTAVEQLKENRRQVLFWNCLNLDEHSLVAIGLNAQINMMKFANNHLSTPNHYHVESYNDYQRSYIALYAYPGSSVAEWLEYKTTKHHIIIDLSSSPPSPKLAFIFCFVLGEYQDIQMFGELQVKLIIDDDDLEFWLLGADHVCQCVMYIDVGFWSIESAHVCVMYDQRCSDFLNRIAKKQTRFKIHVSMEVEHHGIPQKVLKGFGVSPMSTSAYSSFIQQMELRDSMLQFH